MQIGSFQSNSQSALSLASSTRGESAERGPDNDNDGDEGTSAKAIISAASSAELSSSGRGQK
jgi:hypothetical protein